ncbi:hypothetical protein [Paenibacillus thermotolerans]|uniref:hypothetical protein n=1 Tax=Paenibacillus thermotolerans TaxID=3027807 RepID=UPI002368DFBB|nr:MULTISPECIES: hypothetical protein [unclassified Paenibacillus]
MKLTSLLQLTEQHHFSVVRHFGLSSLDVRMITQVYQPMVGAFAAALYHTLSSRVPPDTVGRSGELPLSSLFLSCGLEPNEQGRKRLADETSKLEAVGLLRSSRRVEEDGEVGLYEFRLEKPLTPQEFFDVHHLWILLKEKLGTGLAESIKRSFFSEEPHLEDPEDGVWEDLTAPFFEVFRPSVPPGTDLAMREAAPARAPARPVSEFGRDGFRCSELLRRFPRSSPNRAHVERLERQPELLAEINFIAGKFELTLKETVSLLDEDGMFLPDGRLDGSRFEAKASELFLRSKGREHGRGVLRGKRQQLEADPEGSFGGGEAADSSPSPEIKREAPQLYWLEVPEQFAGAYDVRQYNALLVNSPYTRVLKSFFHPSKVPPGVMEAFLAMNVNYQLPDEVINVMIHYIRMNNLDWTRAFLEAIGGNVAGKRISTFEHAVTYFRKAEKVRGGSGAGSAPEERGSAPARRQPSDYRKGRPAKPVIPIAKQPEAKAASEADIRRLLDKAKQLKDDR